MNFDFPAFLVIVCAFAGGIYLLASTPCASAMFQRWAEWSRAASRGGWSASRSSMTALRARMGQSDLSGLPPDEWREDMDDSGVTLSRGLGWLLLIGAGVIIGAIAAFEFLTDPGLGAGWKVLISAFYLGWLGLFVSVLRQRLIERKTDRYKDVEI